MFSVILDILKIFCTRYTHCTFVKSSLPLNLPAGQRSWSVFRANLSYATAKIRLPPQCSKIGRSKCNLSQLPRYRNSPASPYQKLLKVVETRNQDNHVAQMTTQHVAYNHALQPGQIYTFVTVCYSNVL